MERKARKNKGRAESASSSQHVPRAKDARRNNKAKKWTDPAGRISSAWLRRPWLAGGRAATSGSAREDRPLGASAVTKMVKDLGNEGEGPRGGKRDAGEDSALWSALDAQEVRAALPRIPLPPLSSSGGRRRRRRRLLPPFSPLHPLPLPRAELSQLLEGSTE